MKNLTILISVLLMPVLAIAYNLDPKYLEELKGLDAVIENIATAQEMQASPEESTQEQSQDINKRLLRACKRVIESSKADIIFTRVNSNGVSQLTVSGLFYDVDYIKKHLPQAIHEEANLPTLQALAAYIIDDNPNQNDFETLLAIGLSPLEAYDLTKDYANARVNEEENTINYEHFVKLHWGYAIERVTIPLNKEQQK